VNAVLDDDAIRAIVAACYAYSEPLGLLAEVLAVTGARPVQVKRLRVGDLQSDRLTLMMPRSKKGRGQKRVDRRPVPIPSSLVEKLRIAAAGRPADDPLLCRPDGRPWQTWSDHAVPFAKALAWPVSLSQSFTHSGIHPSPALCNEVLPHGSLPMLMTQASQC
jgi:integrase